MEDSSAALQINTTTSLYMYWIRLDERYVEHIMCPGVHITMKRNPRNAWNCSMYSRFAIKTTNNFTWALSQVFVFAPKVIRDFLLPLFSTSTSASCFSPFFLIFVWRGARVFNAAATGEVSQIVWPLTSWCLAALWHGGQGLVGMNIFKDIGCKCVYEIVWNVKFTLECNTPEVVEFSRKIN